MTQETINDEIPKQVRDEVRKAKRLRGQWSPMGRIEHITTQQIIGEWGSIENFAASHGVSPASTKMVIYVDGAKSRPVEEALRKYGYLNLLRFEKELKKRGRRFGVRRDRRAQPGGADRDSQDEGDTPGGGDRAQEARVLGGAGEGRGSVILNLPKQFLPPLKGEGIVVVVIRQGLQRSKQQIINGHDVSARRRS